MRSERQSETTMPDALSRKIAAPTRNQYGQLLVLASGSAGLSWGKRDTEPLIRRGWVTARWDQHSPTRGFYQMVRVTPEGLHALAEAVRKFGLPEIGPKPRTVVRECADCGSRMYRRVPIPAEEYDPRKARCVA